MMAEDSRFVVSATPFEKRPLDTPAIMRHVIYALIPVVLAAIYYFGLSGLLLILTCIVTCVLTEWLLAGRGPLAASPVGDGSAAVTGILLALTLPPGLALWMAAIGSVVAMVFGHPSVAVGRRTLRAAPSVRAFPSPLSRFLCADRAGLPAGFLPCCDDQLGRAFRLRLLPGAAR